MAEQYYPQWRDQNAKSAYPFEDDASLLDVTSQLPLTQSWLVDAAVYSPIAIPPVFISQITIFGTDGEIVLSDSQLQIIGSGKVDRDGGNPIVILDDDRQPIATLVPGESRSAAIFAAGDGVYDFLPSSATFVDSCVLANPSASLAGLRVGDKTLSTTPLVIVGERGVQLTFEETEETTGSAAPEPVSLIRVHAVGDPQALTRNCQDPARRPGRTIKELVFQYGPETIICKPDEFGNILMLADSPTVVDSSLRINNYRQGMEIALMGNTIA